MHVLVLIAVVQMHHAAKLDLMWLSDPQCSIHSTLVAMWNLFIYYVLKSAILKPKNKLYHEVFLCKTNNLHFLIELFKESVHSIYSVFSTDYDIRKLCSFINSLNCSIYDWRIVLDSVRFLRELSVIEEIKRAVCQYYESPHCVYSIVQTQMKCYCFVM